MAPLRKLFLPVGFLASFFCNGAVAAYLDFTDDDIITSLTSFTDATTNGFNGSIDGIGFTLFTLTSTYGLVNFDESYDGSANTGCQSGGGPLKCDNDGAGIGNDEITRTLAKCLFTYPAKITIDMQLLVCQLALFEYFRLEDFDIFNPYTGLEYKHTGIPQITTLVNIGLSLF